MKQLVRTVGPHATLYRDDTTGIAWVEDGTTGMGHSAHPNIDASGSAQGMKNLGYWGRNDRTVTSHGYVYNIDQSVIDDDYDRVAADNCQCGGHHR